MQTALDREMDTGEKWEKAEDVLMHQSWRSTQAKLLQKKNGLWANRQALSIKHYKFGYQCAFACWDAAISHKTKQEEARTSDKANGLSLFHEGYSG